MGMAGRWKGRVALMGNRRIAGHSYHTQDILFMVPALFFFDFKIGAERFTDMTVLFNFLYLGLGASALCFVTWNVAVKVLGAVKTSVYIYMVSVITVVTSVIVLKEPVTWVCFRSRNGFSSRRAFPF